MSSRSLAPRSVVPEVDTDAAVVAVRRLDNAQRVECIRDVGGRDELEPNEQPMVARPVAQRAERLPCVDDGHVGRPEHVKTAAAELIGNAKCRQLLVERVGSPSRRRIGPRTKGRDLGQTKPSIIEKPRQLRARALGLQALKVPDRDPDGPTAGARGGVDSLSDVVMAAEREMTEDDVVAGEFTGSGLDRHMRTSWSPRRGARQWGV